MAILMPEDRVYSRIFSVVNCKPKNVYPVNTTTPKVLQNSIPLNNLFFLLPTISQPKEHHMNSRTIFLSCLTFLASQFLLAQVSYTTVGGIYSQNFDWTVSNSDTTQTVTWTSNAASQPFTNLNWVGNSLGWYAGSNTQNSTNIRGGNGTDTANAGSTINNYYFASSDTDRSFGGRPTSTVPLVMALRLTNNTGISLTEFTLGYRLEVTHWRASGTQATATMSYLVGNPTNWYSDSSFTAAPTLNLSTVYSGDTGITNTNVNGNAAGNFITLAPTTITGLNWTSGSDLWVRWTFNTGSNLPNVGLDDVSFSAIPEPGTMVMVGCGALAVALTSRRRRR